MARKKIVRIPKVVAIMCRNCNATSRRRAPENSSPQYFDCYKCGQRMLTPVASCCIICAYTNKKCPAALLMEAKVKGLEVR